MEIIGITQQKLEEILSNCLNQIIEKHIIQSSQTEHTTKNYKVKEAAKIRRCSEQTIRKEIKNGNLKAKRFGRAFLIPHAELFNSSGEVKSIKYKR